MPVNALEKGRISDDEILGLLGKPSKPKPAVCETPPHSDSVLDAACSTTRSAGDTSVSRHSSSASRKVKICAKCEHITSIAFTHCPRCGTPLPDSSKPAM
jgi:hypothetical protein